MKCIECQEGYSGDSGECSRELQPLYVTGNSGSIVIAILFYV